MANEGLDEIVADTYQALGLHGRAAMVREGVDPHDGCDRRAIEIEEKLDAILASVPDAIGSVKHSDDCWRRHAACLRDKIYADLGWK